MHAPEAVVVTFPGLVIDDDDGPSVEVAAFGPRSPVYARPLPLPSLVAIDAPSPMTLSRPGSTLRRITSVASWDSGTGYPMIRQDPRFRSAFARSPVFELDEDMSSASASPSASRRQSRVRPEGPLGLAVAGALSNASSRSPSRGRWGRPRTAATSHAADEEIDSDDEDDDDIGFGDDRDDRDDRNTVPPTFAAPSVAHVTIVAPVVKLPLSPRTGVELFHRMPPSFFYTRVTAFLPRRDRFRLRLVCRPLNSLTCNDCRLWATLIRNFTHTVYNTAALCKMQPHCDYVAFDPVRLQLPDVSDGSDDASDSGTASTVSASGVVPALVPRSCFEGCAYRTFRSRKLAPRVKALRRYNKQKGKFLGGTAALTALLPLHAGLGTCFLVLLASASVAACLIVHSELLLSTRLHVDPKALFSPIWAAVGTFGFLMVGCTSGWETWARIPVAAVFGGAVASAAIVYVKAWTAPDVVEFAVSRTASSSDAVTSDVVAALGTQLASSIVTLDRHPHGTARPFTTTLALLPLTVALLWAASVLAFRVVWRRWQIQLVEAMMRNAASSLNDVRTVRRLNEKEVAAAKAAAREAASVRAIVDSTYRPPAEDSAREDVVITPTPRWQILTALWWDPVILVVASVAVLLSGFEADSVAPWAPPIRMAWDHNADFSSPVLSGMKPTRVMQTPVRGNNSSEFLLTLASSTAPLICEQRVGFAISSLLVCLLLFATAVRWCVAVRLTWRKLGSRLSAFPATVFTGAAALAILAIGALVHGGVSIARSAAPSSALSVFTITRTSVHQGDAGAGDTSSSTDGTLTIGCAPTGVVWKPALVLLLIGVGVATVSLVLNTLHSKERYYNSKLAKYSAYFEDIYRGIIVDMTRDELPLHTPSEPLRDSSPAPARRRSRRLTTQAGRVGQSDRANQSGRGREMSPATSSAAAVPALVWRVPVSYTEAVASLRRLGLTQPKQPPPRPDRDTTTEACYSAPDAAPPLESLKAEVSVSPLMYLASIHAGALADEVALVRTQGAAPRPYYVPQPPPGTLNAAKEGKGHRGSHAVVLIPPAFDQMIM